MGRPEVAIVHDYLTQRGGAERVVLSMLKAFPGAPLYTSLYDPATTFPEFADHDVRPLWTNKLRALHRDHRRGLPLYPFAFSTTTIDADVVLCSSSGFAHGVRTTGRKVVYCYTPARWLYGEAPAYLGGWPAPVRTAVRAATPALRAWDRQGMASAGRILTSSTAVAERIRDVYGTDADVVPPPAGLSTRGEERPVAGIEPGFVLSVGRLLPYKNVDGLVAAMEQLPGERLVVAGSGPERERLEAQAGANVTFVGEVDDVQLRWLYANCAGVVSASFEDYGLTPIEAAAYAKPATVLRRGGFVDTVAEGATGVFFDKLYGKAIAEAITRMLGHSWDGCVITAHAARYDQPTFAAALQTAAGMDPIDAVATVAAGAAR